MRVAAALALAALAAAKHSAPRKKEEFGPPGSKRLVVLSGPRTGSSLLVAMLRSHARQILMHGEPFHEDDLRGSAKDGFDGGVDARRPGGTETKPAWADSCGVGRRASPSFQRWRRKHERT